jgi:hypothetical protein
MTTPPCSPPPLAASPPRIVRSPHFKASPPPQLPSPASAHAADDGARIEPPSPTQEAALEALSSYVRSLGGSLPPGWRVDVRTRATGASAGHTDVYFMAPDGARLRSRLDVARHLGLMHRSGMPHAKTGKRLKAHQRAAQQPAATEQLGEQPAAHAEHTPRKREPPAPRVASPFFAAKQPAAKPTPKRAAAATTKRADGSWEPPPSPYGLLQETLYRDPWRVLVACILLNKTTSDAVRRIIWELFELIPTPEAALAVPEEAIARIVRPLGLAKRAAYIKRMSEQYLSSDWRRVSELQGCGQYASDAYALFCSGDWRSLAPPEDKELIKYFRFLQETDGKGRGFTRDPPPKGVCLPGL